MTNLRWKVLTILAVFVLFFSVGVYPILASRYHLPSPSWLQEKQLKLGLDLKGGVHLVLRVQTDDALRLTTEQDMERLRDVLKTQNIRSTASSRRRKARSARPRPKCRRTSIAARASAAPTRSR
jgi:SecD/SecF fusion protein